MKLLEKGYLMVQLRERILSSRTINTVCEYREQLIECMGKIESTSKQAVTINQAGAIRRMVENSKFVFWLTAFHNIMPHVDVLYNQLQKTRTDAALIRKQVNVFQQSLEKERKIMDTVTKEISASYENFKKRKRENIHINRTVAAKEIFNVISNQVKERFCFISHYSTAFLEAPKFQEYEKKFPTQILDQTTDVYSMLQKDRLKTELGVIYRRSDFRNMTGAISFLQFIIENNLQTTFFETYKLLLIIVTIPMTTAEAERCFCTSCSKRKKWVRTIYTETQCWIQCPLVMKISDCG
ncbi:hypothetical protein AVEN_155057-1 [Araneus ventricosus]|uniref:HAT C-terminal dimerisation domain-containing protein n=1 Tax=Araneus ventricosus TaxID=182803 RepID=A0A4Y2A7F6_ARAVE|nr:hypothetical protein AVEN_155057-1 [Araneus ventricosus]